MDPAADTTPTAPSVLLIDDVDATRTGLADLLRLRGYKAHEAANAMDGLRILREERGVRVIVLDVVLPGASGFWFREQQMHDPAIAGIPVILFTGAADVDGPTPLAVDEVVHKPLAVGRLLELLAHYCEH